MSNEIKFWQGTNFWIALILAFGGVFVGFPEGEAKYAIEAIFATIAALFAVREKVKDLTIDWKAWITSKNTWNYLAAALTAVFPLIPLDLFAKLNELITAIIGGNWQGIVTAIFSIATMLYYIFRKPTQPTTV